LIEISIHECGTNKNMGNNIKIICIILTLAFFSHNSIYSQTVDSIYIEVDTYPDFGKQINKTQTFENLSNKIEDYFQNNTELTILKKQHETSEYKDYIALSFVVEKDGTLTDVKIKTRITKIAQEEILELLKNTGIWNPGRINRDAVRTSLCFIIYVSLER